MRIPFTKMQGAGNDYIYVDTTQTPLPHPEALAVAWSRRHTGIGSDGLVLIGRSDRADFSMRIFNADGSEARMCGNASRCIGKYVYEHGLTDKTDIALDTLSGIKTLHLHVEDGTVDTVTAAMGRPEGTHTRDEGADYSPREGIAVDMGNPHLVLFVDDAEAVDLTAVGPALERHPLFPHRVNVEFAHIRPDGSIRMRVWERGSGITMACGTGACATAVAAAFSHRTGRQADIAMDGGMLSIEWNKADGRVRMTGPAVEVFCGTINL